MRSLALRSMLAVASAMLALCLPPLAPAYSGDTPTTTPRVFLLNPATLAATKAKVASGDTATIKPALDKLLADADKALTLKPVSVMDKTRIPPSGDKHDYMSLAPYFWPDPTKKDGMPYIRKDGQRNPSVGEPANSDAPHMGRMSSAVDTLSLAYYLTGKEAYATQAARLLRTWFLDPATRMKPNLNYGQAVPGVNDGRGTGIIDTRGLAQLADSIGLLAGSPSWTATDQAGMVDWMRQYLDWLQTSKNGKDEGRASNNHGTFYDAQVVSLALFTGQTDLAHRVLETAETKRIASQIEPDGTMPRELARTRSLGYSLFNLTAMEELAMLGDRAGVDLWSFQTSDGRSIRKALDNLGVYADPNKPWTHQQITNQDRASLLPLLLQANAHYHDATYQKEITLLPADKTRDDRAWLLY